MKEEIQKFAYEITENILNRFSLEDQNDILILIFEGVNNARIEKRMRVANTLLENEEQIKSIDSATEILSNNLFNINPIEKGTVIDSPSFTSDSTGGPSH